MKYPVEIFPVNSVDRSWVIQELENHWMSSEIALRGQLLDVSQCPGYYAVRARQKTGLIMYREFQDSLEILSLCSNNRGIGIGRALIGAVIEKAKELKKPRILVITMNSNLDALAFYQACGFSVKTVFTDSIAQLRLLKPQIPMIDQNGLPIKDEIELEFLL